MGKCHLMLVQIHDKYQAEQRERDNEEQLAWYSEEYQRRYQYYMQIAQQESMTRQIDEILDAQPGHDDIRGADTVFDYDSEDSECMHLYSREEEYDSDNVRYSPTDPFSIDEETDEVLSRIDFSEEIDLNKLYD